MYLKEETKSLLEVRTGSTPSSIYSRIFYSRFPTGSVTDSPKFESCFEPYLICRYFLSVPSLEGYAVYFREYLVHGGVVEETVL